MKGKDQIHSWLSLKILFIFLFLIPCGTFSLAQTKKDALQKTKKHIEEEIKYTNMLLEQTQKSKQTSLNRLQILNRQIERRQSLIETINQEINGIQGEIDLQSDRINKLTSDLQKMKEEYARLIYFAYKNLNLYNRLMFVFSAEDFNQAFRRIRYYQQYSSYRRTQAELIRKTQLDLAQKVHEMEETKMGKQNLANIKNQEKNKMVTEKEIKDKTVNELSQKEKQLLAALKEKQQAAQKLQKEIERIIAEEIKASAYRVRSTSKTETRTKRENKGSEIMLTPHEKELSESFSANKGKLPWPTEKGIVTSTFGEHPHPVLKYVKVKNNGIDVTTEKGANIRSVFAGKVTRVMSFPNMNKVVIIRHGEYLTVYSNLEEVNVKDGQEIVTKQAIGKVHTNEDDARTEYHFEIWLGKTIQDPQEWLSGAN